MNKIIRFVKDWTLPIAICVGTVSYLTFNYVPALDALGDTLSPVFDVIFPLFVFLTLLVTFCKVDFHQMLPHRWHTGILIAQLLLVALNIVIILWAKEAETAEDSSRFTLHSSLKQWGENLHKKVKQYVGMPVSIGLALNKTLAKVASHFAKKYQGYRHCCLIDTDGKRIKALKLYPIEDVWGIGRRYAAKHLYRKSLHPR